MTKFRANLFLAVGVAALLGLHLLERHKDSMVTNKPDENTIAQFRQESEERLKKPDGWLTVVGLTWLKEGANSLGSDEKNAVHLPSGTPAQMGEITLNAGLAKIKFSVAQNVFVDETPAELNKEYILIDDKSDKPTKIKVSSVTFFLINRKNGIGVRIKDENSEARLNFKEKKWFPPNSDFIINADWVAFAEPKKIMVPDVLGNVNEETSPGLARFIYEGEKIELIPTLEDNQLFYVFRDQTSGKETYGASRFLYSDQPKDGHVILDFNRATNPPCAFTHYATCPLPPRENILKVAIRAGELAP